MNTAQFSEIRVILLSGEEFQRLERLSEILGATVDEATRDFNLDTIRPEDFAVGKLSELIMTFPMIASRRVIVLRDFDSIHKDVRKKACEIIAKTPETTLVIVEGEKANLLPKPKKYFFAESFKPVYENRLPQWIKDRFRKRSKKITDSAAALLMNNVGTVLRELDSEIGKVTIIAGDREQVSEDVVKKVVGAFKRDTVWGLCNAVGLGDFNDVLKILANLLANEKNKETFYIASLYSHIIKISEYNLLRKNGVPHSEALKVATTNQYFWDLNKMNAQTRNLNPGKVRQALTVLGHTESALKGSRIDNKLLMELTIPFLMRK